MNASEEKLMKDLHCLFNELGQMVGESGLGDGDRKTKEGRNLERLAHLRITVMTFMNQYEK